jgi:hypothetical protein
MNICGRFRDGDPELGEPESVRAGFVELFGHAQYADIGSYENSGWRASFIGTGECELFGCGEHGPALVFDHCHRHGWVRGLLCPSHNVRLGQIDAVRAIEGAVVDLMATPYGRYLPNCFECSGSQRRHPCDDTSQWAIERPRVRVAISEWHVRPGGTVSHLKLADSRTWCGRSAEALVPAEAGVLRCGVCFRGASRVTEEPAAFDRPTGSHTNKINSARPGG